MIARILHWLFCRAARTKARGGRVSSSPAAAPLRMVVSTFFLLVTATNLIL